MLNRSRDTVLDIKNNTEFDPGWIQNGGIFIARNKVKIIQNYYVASIGENTFLETIR